MSTSYPFLQPLRTSKCNPRLHEMSISWLGAAPAEQASGLKAGHPSRSMRASYSTGLQIDVTGTHGSLRLTNEQTFATVDNAIWSATRDAPKPVKVPIPPDTEPRPTPPSSKRSVTWRTCTPPMPQIGTRERTWPRHSTTRSDSTASSTRSRVHHPRLSIHTEHHQASTPDRFPRRAKGPAHGRVRRPEPGSWTHPRDPALADQ